MSYQAYSILEDIFKENRKKRNSKLLYCPSRPKLPVDPGRFVEMLRFFCVKYYKEIGSTQKEYADTLSGVCTVKQYNNICHGHEILTTEQDSMADVSETQPAELATL